MVLDPDERAHKRRKYNEDSERKPLDIKGVFELHERLRFRQSIRPEVKAGLVDFRTFLNNISQNEDPYERDIQLKVLKQYCDEQSAATKEEIDFSDILSTWSYAAQSNEEGVLSAVPSVLAIFLRTISKENEFQDFGLSLCHSLLKPDQLRLLERNLSAPKHKPHLLSPTLRLLAEIVSFDNGTLARNVFLRRDTLFRRLDALLEIGHVKTDADGARPPSIRRVAQRLLVALLKYLDTESKAEMVSQGRTLHACIRDLSSDSADAIVELLRTLRAYVIDSEIPDQVRARFLNATNLASLANLYFYKKDHVEAADDPVDGVDVRQAVHAFLSYVCTSSNGILVSQSGWYPPGASLDLESDDVVIDLGLDSPYYFDDYSSNVPVKNSALSAFIQALKPEKDLLQADLIVSIFSKAPELVADYFSKQMHFPMPPKDDPVWRSYFAFLFKVVQLPIPANLGWHDSLPVTPPPLSIVIENILPRPFDAATLSRGLNVQEEIVTMSVVRVLTIAIQKLNAINQVFNPASHLSNHWNQAIGKLSELFVKRIPPLQDLITSLQRTSFNSTALRSALLECMTLYYTALPSTTTASRFDMSSNLSLSLRQLGGEEFGTESKKILTSQLLNLATIANVSKVSKWWQKPDEEPLSPFTTLFRYCVTMDDSDAQYQIQTILKSLLVAKGVICYETASFDALLSSVTNTRKWSADIETFEFLDNCIARSMKQPVKYLDQLESAQQFVSDKKPLSLLACCVVEQWPFVLKRHESHIIKNIAEWLTRFFTLLDQAGENYRVMMYFQQEILKQAQGKDRSTLEKVFDKQRRKPAHLTHWELDPTIHATKHVMLADTSTALERRAASLEELFEPLEDYPTALPGLEKWDKVDFESEMNSENSHLCQLVKCFSSSNKKIRQQALDHLQKVMHHLDTSIYPEKQQLHLVLGELSETVGASGFDNPIPSVIPELAIQLMHIISNPSDTMYGKANRFLIRSPSWETFRLISYWMDKILLSEPENDNGHHQEVTRFLDLLIRSLRNAIDMELFRRSNVFERVLSLYSSADCSRPNRRKILHLIYRALQAGGADTLVTRLSIRTWLRIASDSVTTTTRECHEIIELLQVRIEESCTKGYVERWEEARPVFRKKATTLDENRE